jgi:ribosome-associated protein
LPDLSNERFLSEGAAIAKKIPQSRIKALKIREFVLEKKAQKPVIFEIDKISNLCDYFVICSADTGVQAKAIFDGVVEKCQAEKISIHHYESDEEAQWILVDFFDVVLHIFVNECRKFYNLEHLWSDAKRIRVSRVQKTDSRRQKSEVEFESRKKS